HVSYDSFGNILGESNPSAGDRFKFTAREFDQLTLLYHSYAGFYDPAVGGSVGLSRESPASGHRVIDPERVIAVHLNAVGILQTRQGDRSPRLKNIFSPPLFPDGPSSPHPDSYPDKIFEPAKPIKGATWPRGDELRDPTVFPYIHGQRVRLQRLSEEDYKERGFVIWKNLSKGHENRYVLTYTQIGSDFRINFNTAPKPKQTGNWKAAGTFHTHPSTGAGNPADSPLDPKNSNRTWGTKQPPVPWLIGDPLGTVWLIGPDYRGGSPNETSR
ncbi:MAG: hypothetical protein SFX72_15925, partial [Isosphaeraceae bacterium]|nr:hypothetical protein [Isosphaeraceae bacterium]